MSLLILCANYPGFNEKAALAYVKSRIHVYREKGIQNIVVLNFSLSEGSYVEDGVEVISLKEYQKSYKEDDFELLVCHAPNLRNHYLFLIKYQKRFKQVVFFFHGHEVLSIKKEYPKPYRYQKKNNFSRLLLPIYDSLKFYLWHDYFAKQNENVHMIFVSKWIYNKFEEYVGLEIKKLKARSYIISNNISKRFENESYNINIEKEYDFITIRSNLDDPKYAVDIVNNLAFANPQYKFLLVGRGEYFNHYPKASNIEQIERYISPDEMISLFNKSKCALMPTKNDTQGIMACEMATFGMPLITSDIDVCKIVFEGFSNVAFISNNNPNINLASVLGCIEPFKNKVDTYFRKNTIYKEIELLKMITENE